MTARSRTRIVVWTAVAAGLLLLVAANAHLVYTALATQPACVAHLKAPDGAPGTFRAARSAC